MKVMKTKQLTKSSPKRQLVPDIIIPTACLVPQHSPAPSLWVETNLHKNLFREFISNSPS